jgi:hypothetical protein
MEDPSDHAQEGVAREGVAAGDKDCSANIMRSDQSGPSSNLAAVLCEMLFLPH